ncbi:unnamed protein product, partial [Discosporangium mesarthrocarpum]
MSTETASPPIGKIETSQGTREQLPKITRVTGTPAPAPYSASTVGSPIPAGILSTPVPSVSSPASRTPAVTSTGDALKRHSLSKSVGSTKTLSRQFFGEEGDVTSTPVPIPIPHGDETPNASGGTTPVTPLSTSAPSPKPMASLSGASPGSVTAPAMAAAAGQAEATWSHSPLKTRRHPLKPLGTPTPVVSLSSTSGTPTSSFRNKLRLCLQNASIDKNHTSQDEEKLGGLREGESGSMLGTLRRTKSLNSEGAYPRSRAKPHDEAKTLHWNVSVQDQHDLAEGENLKHRQAQAQGHGQGPGAVDKQHYDPAGQDWGRGETPMEDEGGGQGEGRSR